MYYTYIIKSEKDGTYYTGQCKSLSERLFKHNKGYSSSTKAKKPWELVYFEEFETRNQAARRELEIKRNKSRKYIEELISKFK